MVDYKKPSEKVDFDDFFSRFSFVNYLDKMSLFEDK